MSVSEMSVLELMEESNRLSAELIFLQPFTKEWNRTSARLEQVNTELEKRMNDNEYYNDL